MVHPKVGAYGALAQYARKKQKENSTSKETNKPRILPQVVPSTVNKKQPKQKKGLTDKQIREKNERKLLRQEMKKGNIKLKDGNFVENIDVLKFEKKLDLLQQDEKTGEDQSEVDLLMKDGKKKTDAEWKKDRKKKDLEIQKKPITQTKLLQKYKVDRDDYMLQYATAEEKPVYFEEYEPSAYPCFHSTNPCLWGVAPNVTCDRLLQYTNEIMKSYVPPKTDHLPSLLVKSDKLRVTSPYTNFCFNPVQALRAWGLLANIAQNKTFDELRKYIDYYTALDTIEKNGDSLNKLLLSLHYESEFLFDGCVRLFTELPRHLHHNVEVRRKISTYYGGRSKRAGVQHHCFQTDSDGFYSCYRINQEVSLSTRGSVRYVVPENSAPNWRASIALASAMDCTFYWKTTGARPIEINNFEFTESIDNEVRNSMCVVISAEADIATFDKYVRLESHQPGVYLYIIPEDRKNAHKKKSFPSNTLDIINGVWTPLSRQKVYIPKCTTSIPISLYEHAKHYGLSRLFSGEKSELRQLNSSGFDAAGSPQFATLFDHYHKTVFEIETRQPGSSDLSRDFDELAPDRAHQSIDDSMANVFGKFQMDGYQSYDPLFTYHEDHLDRSPTPFLKSSVFYKKNNAGLDLAFPFYYVMTRKIKTMPVGTEKTKSDPRDLQESPLIVCAGYFNNTPWVKNK
ncbi:hypothetical protein GCK72_020273 [Caenorhabditis remanei]|uniref:Serpin domain-containing protein n=1 Tax=Caenorhabditis remanei TaxID=31234 RepID=A0A6A5GG74_CAERE|nr:hypothetical protein GCK72_020273 [Caenorhabditis remanei]KAF1753716.1 hypothetical protein GCK72_020273 [Caenorhabditis remanei]